MQRKVAKKDAGKATVGTIRAAFKEVFNPSLPFEMFKDQFGLRVDAGRGQQQEEQNFQTRVLQFIPGFKDS